MRWGGVIVRHANHCELTEEEGLPQNTSIQWGMAINLKLIKGGMTEYADKGKEVE